MVRTNWGARSQATPPATSSPPSADQQAKRITIEVEGRGTVLVSSNPDTILKAMREHARTLNEGHSRLGDLRVINPRQLALEAAGSHDDITEDLSEFCANLVDAAGTDGFEALDTDDEESVDESGYTALGETPGVESSSRPPRARGTNGRFTKKV